MSKLTDIGYGADSARTASISEDGLYRYRLGRDWTPRGREKKVATFIMLNPSTADSNEDDPTIRRCIGFADEFGCTALTVVNLYAFRATDPRALTYWESQGADLNGPMNYDYLRIAIQTATRSHWPLVAAWGSFVDQLSSSKAQLGWLRRELTYQWGVATCLGKTKDGHPRHPLYLKAGTELEVWYGQRA